MRRILTTIFALAVAGPAFGTPVSFEDYVTRSTRIERIPNAVIAYGPADTQRAELYLPEGRGPFPVAILIHGGCWSRELPGREQMRAVAGDLIAHGVAVWNIGYRRADEAGGGYPGTFQDIGAAVDMLRQHRARLDLRRLVFIGHSAGAHLALWAAARPRLPRSSILRSERPLMPRAVIALDAATDLESLRQIARDACGGDPIAPLVGEGRPGRSDVYADTSPGRLVPLRTRQIIFNGSEDIPGVVPTSLAYAQHARAAGDSVRIDTLAEAGHFDAVAPWSQTWPTIRRAILASLGIRALDPSPRRLR